MLKISVLSTALGTTLKLEGKLGGEGIDQLELCWQALRATAGSRRFCIDIADVSSVSEQGEQLLESISREGAVIARCNRDLAIVPISQSGRPVASPPQDRNSEDSRRRSFDAHRSLFQKIAASAEAERRTSPRLSPSGVAMLKRICVLLALGAALFVIRFAVASMGAAAVAKTLICFTLVLAIGLLIVGIRNPAMK
jgi:hypothetical protein